MTAPLLLMMAVAASAGPYDRPAGNPDTAWGKQPVWHTTVTALKAAQVEIPAASRKCLAEAKPKDSCRLKLLPPESGRWRTCPGVMVGRDLLAVNPSRCGLSANAESTCGTTFYLAAVDPAKPDQPANLVKPAVSLTPYRDMSGPAVAVYRLLNPLGVMSDRALARAHAGLTESAEKLGVKKADLVAALGAATAPGAEAPSCD